MDSEPGILFFDLGQMALRDDNSSNSQAVTFCRCTTAFGIFFSQIHLLNIYYLSNFGQKTCFAYRKKNRWIPIGKKGKKRFQARDLQPTYGSLSAFAIETTWFIYFLKTLNIHRGDTFWNRNNMVYLFFENTKYWPRRYILKLYLFSENTKYWQTAFTYFSKTLNLDRGDTFWNFFLFFENTKYWKTTFICFPKTLNVDRADTFRKFKKKFEMYLLGQYFVFSKKNKGKTPECRIPPSDRATRRYTKVHLDFCLRFPTLIGQIGRVPLSGAGPRRYIRSPLFRLVVTVFWRALTASWRQKASESRFSSGHSHYRTAFESFAREHSRRCATDTSEQPDTNLTDLFDTWHHATMAAWRIVGKRQGVLLCTASRRGH